MPLFFWLLDITTINSWIICNEYRKQQGLKSYSQRDFRIDLAWELAQEGFRTLNPTHAATLTHLSPSFPSVSSSSHFIHCDNLQPNGRHCPGVRPLGNSSDARQTGKAPLSLLYYLDNNTYFSGYVTKGSKLPLIRKHTTTEHFLIRSEKRHTQCFLCRLLTKLPLNSPLRAQAYTTGWSPPRGQRRTTLFLCNYCSIPLCKSPCFNLFHKLEDNESGH